jgi:ubiquinone/menaquinone biosynthesis C-methylase UbiE
MGVDIQTDRIATARERYPSIRFEHYDGSRIPAADAAFDGVWMNEVIEHVADERLTLGEAYRVLGPGGTLIVRAPNRGFLSRDT